MRILFATSECAPWVKTGGLGDVASALPRALAGRGHDVRVLLPAYRGVADALGTPAETVPVEATGPWPAAMLHRHPSGDGAGDGTADGAGRGVEVWLLDCPALYDRDGGPYLGADGREHADNAERFGFLSRVAASLSDPGGPLGAAWPVEVLHANDWQTALAPAYVSLRAAPRARTVLTIHNLAFQGSFDRRLAGALELPDEWLAVDGLLHWDRLNFLKAGIRHADAITTVSPTHAREIQGERLGFGLDGMLRLRAGDLVGILNGIDEAVWDPRHDPLIARRYESGDWRGKAMNRIALQRQAGLDGDASAFILGSVGRLAEQKGVDRIAELAPGWVGQGFQLVLLGSGDAALERRLSDLAAAHPGRIAVRIGHDEPFAHAIEAGADVFLMPSRFEPCGLNQMYSQAYGTPPIVGATGGLLDTVVDDDAAPGAGTGFVLAGDDAAALADAVARAARAWRDPRRWRALQRRAMARRWSWEESAARYEAVYAGAGAGPR